MMKFEATFSEHGRVMTRTYDKPDATKEDVIEWFGLPTLLAAMEIQGQKEDIDALAKTIEDADLLRDTNSDVWSCSRSGRAQGWFVNGYYGDLYRCDVWCSFLAVPVILY